MTIVIDTNTFCSVFDPENADHDSFKPVLTWIEQGQGFMVYGGSTYFSELVQSYRRARLIRLMKDAGRAIEVQKSLIDLEEERIKTLTRGTNCNDQHIIALLVVSNCKILCSSDKESYPHVKNKALYPKGFSAVRIYSNKHNAKKLLVKTSRSQIRNQA